MDPWVLVLVLVIAAALLVYVQPRVARRLVPWRRSRIRASFDRNRAALQSRLFETGSIAGWPHESSWLQCDFADGCLLARDQLTGNPKALTGVRIQLDASPAAKARDDLQIVDGWLEGTAVFELRRGKWRTDGRVIFHLNPKQVIRLYPHELEELA